MQKKFWEGWERGDTDRRGISICRYVIHSQEKIWENVNFYGNFHSVWKVMSILQFSENQKFKSNEWNICYSLFDQEKRKKAVLHKKIPFNPLWHCIVQ
jgi:hypothetical protein